MWMGTKRISATSYVERYGQLGDYYTRARSG
jgi:hypothetical protein